MRPNPRYLLALIPVGLMLIFGIGGWLRTPAETPALAADPTSAPPIAQVPRLQTLKPKPTAVPTEEPTAAPTAVPTPAPTAEPTAVPAPAPLRVGIQVGHWKANELPDELKKLRDNTGAYAAGVSEIEINLSIAQRVVELLQRNGIIADLLPATVPPNYQADAIIAIHADGSPSTAARGFKLATPWRTSPASQHLMDAIVEEYRAATQLPQDGSITINMKGYYAFSYRRYTHASTKTTPATIIETGFVTSPVDRAFLTQRPDVAAVGIANGIIRYLNERDPNDKAALNPPEFPLMVPKGPEGADVRAAPRDDAALLQHVDQETRLIPVAERDGWLQVVNSRDWHTVGWVRRDQLRPNGEPLPVPPQAQG